VVLEWEKASGSKIHGYLATSLMARSHNSLDEAGMNRREIGSISFGIAVPLPCYLGPSQQGVAEMGQPRILPQRS
jgi:hypothetical protein